MKKVVSPVLYLCSALSLAHSTAAQLVVIDGTTPGYHNISIGTALDGSSPLFPRLNPGGDPVIDPAPEPDLTLVAGALGSWLMSPPVISSAWSGLQQIPRQWPVGHEDAVIYRLDVPVSPADVRIRIGTDNGAYVYFDGVYRTGHTRGGLAVLGEIDFTVTNVSGGSHWIQVIREDHGGATGFDIEVTVSRAPAPINVSRVVTSSDPAGVSGFGLATLAYGGIIVFGGATSVGLSAQTHELFGSTWSQQFPLLNPAPRRNHSIAHFGASGEVVLFGGVNPLGVNLADTWTYANSEWAFVAPAHSPPARSGHAVVFDPMRGMLLLFGGKDAAGGVLSDMWGWNGIDWSQLSPATLPPARHGHGMAYDALRERVVLFGGNDGVRRVGDVWEWNGHDWEDVTPAQSPLWCPSARESFAIAYDPRGERVLVHGGETDSGCSAEFWSWDGMDWTRHLPVGSTPTARSGHAMFYDPAVDDLRLFGGGCGSALGNELWKLELPAFHRYSTYGAGCAGTVGVPTLAAQAGTRPVVGETFVAELTNLPTSPGAVAFGLLGFSKDALGGVPLPLDLAAIGMPGCSLLTSAEETTTLPNFGGRATMTLPVTPSLVGYTLYLQCAVLDRFANSLGIVLSNGLEFRIGNR